MPGPTVPQDVSALLKQLLEKLRQLLADQLVGMYLFGSLTTNDFDEDSDVDVLVVTVDDLSETQFNALYAMHVQLSQIDSIWATQLEISYIPQAALRRFDPAHATHPHLDRDRGEVLHWKQHSSDWVIQRHVLRNRGIVITGPEPKGLIDPVSIEDLQQANRAILTLWASEFDGVPDWIRGRGGQSYTVLTMCRMLYLARFGEVASKPAASRWAQTALDERWKPLIERVWVGRHNPALEAEPEDIAETVAFVHFVVATVAEMK